MKPEHAQALHRSLHDEGGFSFRNTPGDGPTRGYMVAIPGHEEVHDLKDTTSDTVSSYIHKKQGVVQANSKLHYGGWHDPSEGKVYFDLSEHHKTRDGAIAAGHAHGQKAIYNIEHGESVYLHPSTKESRLAGHSDRIEEELGHHPTYLVAVDAWTKRPQHHGDPNKPGEYQGWSPARTTTRHVYIKAKNENDARTGAAQMVGGHPDVEMATHSRVLDYDL